MFKFQPIAKFFHPWRTAFEAKAKVVMERIVANNQHKNEGLGLWKSFIQYQVVDAKHHRLTFVLVENLDRTSPFEPIHPLDTNARTQFRYSVWRMLKGEECPTRVFQRTGWNEDDYMICGVEFQSDNTIIVFGLDDDKWDVNPTISS